jgi:hypothetical protein
MGNIGIVAGIWYGFGTLRMEPLARQWRGAAHSTTPASTCPVNLLLISDGRRPRRIERIITQDTGLRPEETFRIRVEKIDWNRLRPCTSAVDSLT